MRIGIMGGTFDPIHFGHLNLLLGAKSSLKLNKIIIVPNSNPFYKVKTSSFKHVKEMLNIAIDNKADISISNIESDSNKKHYTYNSLKNIVLDKKNVEYFLLIGSDHSKSFQTWFEPKKILDLVNLVIVDRPGYSSDIMNLLKINKLFKRQLKYKSLIVNYNKINKKKIIRLTLKKNVEISSTDIREAFKSFNEEMILKLIPKKIYEYIIKNGLYK
jgi:nicotinate (nicotinamide) nucleotide adenylyltransferase|tara:strand:+ start:22216 stop:22863 length:648 start_codon:yes stop_codon:yes gene_type:complete